MACRVGSRRVEALVAALAHVLLPVAGAPARLQVRALVQACRWHMERQDEAASWNLHWSAAAGAVGHETMPRAHWQPH